MTRRRWLLGIALGVLCAASAPAANYGWSSTGPLPGWINQIVTHPTRPGEMYAVTQFGGLHKSLDGGASWSTMGQGNRDIGSWIALDPLDPDLFYVASFESVLVTRDRGSTFQQKSTGSAPLTQSRVEVSADSSVLYAIGSSVRKSLDGGESWTVSYTNTTSGLILATHPSIAQTAFILTSEGLLRTVNGGESWEPYGTGLPIPFEGAAFCISRLNPQVLLAGTVTQGAYRSFDGGANWAPLPTVPFPYLYALIADPFVAGRFLWTSSLGLAFTDDNGDTWSRIDPLLDRPVLSSAFDPSVAWRIHAGVSINGYTGSLFRTDDLGETWTTSAADGLFGGYTSSVATHPTRPAVAFAGSLRGVHRTQNGGRTWEFLFALPAVQELVIDKVNPQRLWAAAYEGVQRSLDGGETWSPASNGLPAETPFDIEQDPTQTSILYTVMGTGIYKTTNGGDSWAPTGALPTGVQPRVAAVDSSDSSIVYFGGSGYPNPSLYRSQDGGASWDPASEPQSIAFDVKVDPADPLIVYVLTASFLWKSTDRGLSFSQLPPWTASGPEGMTGIALRLDPANSSVLYVLDWLGVFRSPDAGQTWHRLTNESFAGGFLATDLALSADGRTLFQANWGGVFTFDRRWNDVPDADPFFPSIDLVALHAVTAGCGGGNFCPNDAVTRAQSSVFLLRSLEGSLYEPTPATGAVFADVPADSFAAAWIEELFDRGITAGCGSGLFCPDLEVTRAQAAVLNLSAKNGDSYQPPPATGTFFADVPVSHFAAAWIEEFARQGYTAGCAPSLYCPDQAVTRAQMAVFLAGVFTLL